MSIKKTFTSSNFTILKNGDKNNFPEGTKYIFNGEVWTVTQAVKDGGDEWRKVINASRTIEESLLLSTLIKDSKSEGFTFIKEDKNDKQV